MEWEGQLVPLLQTAACACASAVNATKDSTPLIRPGPSNPLWSVDRLESQTAAFEASTGRLAEKTLPTPSSDSRVLDSFLVAVVLDWSLACQDRGPPRKLGGGQLKDRFLMTERVVRRTTYFNKVQPKSGWRFREVVWTFPLLLFSFKCGVPGFGTRPHFQPLLLSLQIQVQLSSTCSCVAAYSCSRFENQNFTIRSPSPSSGRHTEHVRWSCRWQAGTSTRQSVFLAITIHPNGALPIPSTMTTITTLGTRGRDMSSTPSTRTPSPTRPPTSFP